MNMHGFDFKALIELYKLIKAENIHILRTHQYHANLYGRLAGVLAGVPVIIPTYHNLYNSPNKPKCHRRLINYLLSIVSDKLVAVSGAVANDIMVYDKVQPNKVKIIYNGIEINRFKKDILKEDIRKELGLPFSTIVGTVGRLTEQKGHKFLIEAASGIEGVCVAIAGDGHLRKELMDLAKRLKVNCLFMGMLSPEKVPKFLKSLDIFCFPSLWEGFGIALIEAMASGLPIIASDIPPHREVLGDAGVYFPQGNVSALSYNINQLIENKTLREMLGEMAKERAELFSIEKTVKEYEKLYNEILNKKMQFKGF
jgi:glycosyltransferase involved in cell wall biosynthesis